MLQIIHVVRGNINFLMNLFDFLRIVSSIKAIAGLGIFDRSMPANSDPYSSTYAMDVMSKQFPPKNDSIK